MRSRVRKQIVDDGLEACFLFDLAINFLKVHIIRYWQSKKRLNIGGRHSRQSIQDQGGVDC